MLQSGFEATKLKSVGEESNTAVLVFDNLQKSWWNTLFFKDFRCFLLKYSLKQGKWGIFIWQTNGLVLNLALSKKASYFTLVMFMKRLKPILTLFTVSGLVFCTCCQNSAEGKKAVTQPPPPIEDTTYTLHLTPEEKAAILERPRNKQLQQELDVFYNKQLLRTGFNGGILVANLFGNAPETPVYLDRLCASFNNTVVSVDVPDSLNKIAFARKGEPLTLDHAIFNRPGAEVDWGRLVDLASTVRGVHLAHRAAVLSGELHS